MDQLVNTLHSETLKILSTLTCKGTTKTIINNLFSGVGKIIAIFVLQYHLKNSQDTVSFFNSVCRGLFYKSIRFDMSETSFSLCIATRLKREIPTVLTYNGFPMYFHTESEYGVLQILPGIHSHYFNNLVNLAKQDYERHLQNTKTTQTICRTLDDHFKPKNLFPSKNYIRFNEIISAHFEISRMTELFSTLGILLDGEPGLGKSDSVEYLARQGIYGEVLKIDMTTQLNRPFGEVVSSVFKTKRRHSLIILFDELDKYFDYNIRASFRESQKEIQKDDQKPLEQHHNLHQTKAEYFIEQKETYLYKLLNMLESNYFDHGVVFIFCSNNFDAIFEGVNEKHFVSLNKRFLRITFERCQCEEFKDYIRFFNKQFDGTPWFRESNELELLLSNIKDNLRIPYRQLCHLNISSCYNVEKFIDAVNAWEDDNESEDNGDEDSEDNEHHDIKDSKNSDNKVNGDNEYEDGDSNEYEYGDGDSNEDYEDNEYRNGLVANRFSNELLRLAAPPTPIKLVTTPPRLQIIENITKKLNDIDNAPTHTAKVRLAIELFELLSSRESIQLIRDYPNFWLVIKTKLAELKSDVNTPELVDEFERVSNNLETLLS